jgi:hypothetical protein
MTLNSKSAGARTNAVRMNLKTNGINFYRIFQILALCVALIPASASARESNLEIVMSSQSQGLSGKDPIEWVASFAGDMATSVMDAWRITTNDNYGEEASAYATSLHSHKFSRLILASNPAVTVP